MLDRESESLDLQKISFSEQAIEIDTQGMSGQLGQQTGTQSPKGMGVIELNVELFGQLTIDGFNNLTHSVKSAREGFGQLVFLVATRQGCEFEAVLSQQLTGQFSADVAFVSEDSQILMLCQQFSADVQVSDTGGS